MATTKCPVCGTPGAKKFLWRVKCVNKTCSKFNMEHYMESDSLHGSTSAPASAPASMAAKAPAHPVEIRYRNFEGAEKTYTGDASTVRFVKNHVSICLAPTGLRCAFNRDSILNMPQLEPKLPKKPRLTHKEAQILGYYRKRGGTSAEFERIRRDHPEA